MIATEASKEKEEEIIRNYCYRDVYVCVCAQTHNVHVDIACLHILNILY